jgi:hypothetical protein
MTILLSCIAFAQHGIYTEPGYESSAPLTIFDRKVPLISQLDTIRDWIVNKKKLYDSLYSSIYTNAFIGSTSCNCPSNKNQSLGSSTAKDAAFVALIGLDDTGGTLSTTLRNNFRNKALTILQSLDEVEKRCFRGDLGDHHQWRSAELILYLQAYDLLKTANVSGGLFTHPQKDGSTEIIS